VTGFAVSVVWSLFLLRMIDCVATAHVAAEVCCVYSFWGETYRCFFCHLGLGSAVKPCHVG
jgi:adenine C2-methylase RlmN of 23S rRNA A2503 and tRNA A37